MKELLVLLVLLLVLLPRKEHFFSSKKQCCPLLLDRKGIYNPTHWKYHEPHLLSTTITIKALQGEMDAENIKALPGFGFPDKSGGEWYSNINKIRGRDGWDYQNEARHGNDWFHWRPTGKWERSSKKEKELEVLLIVSENMIKPEFPVSFSIRIPDKNRPRSLRYWVTMTKPPSVEYFTHPLVLKENEFAINKLPIAVPIVAEQGEIDWSSFQEKQGDVSWRKGTTFKDKGHIILEANSNFSSCFPVRHTLRLKDLHRDRYVYVNLFLRV